MFKDIESKVLKFIKDNSMLDEGQMVYVATSGGADSMALLSFLYSHKKQLGITVRAAHVNHGIRGNTADRDANFVADYCASKGIHFTLFDASGDGTLVPENASEDWARQLRYKYFNSLEPTNSKIATAHTLSDQAETVIFRLARGGSGLQGLTGIPAIRGRFIRPFLCLTRSEIEELVDYYGTGNITDETNLGDDYSRNKIRHYVIPQLKNINDKAEDAIGKAVERIAKAQDFIHRVAVDELNKAMVFDKENNYSTYNFYMQDDIVLEEMLRVLLSKAGKCTEEHIEILKKHIKNYKSTNSEEVIGSTDLTDDMCITVTTRFITIIDRSKERAEHKLEVGKRVYFGCFGLGVVVEEMEYADYAKLAPQKTELCNYADANKIDISSLIVRGKHAGDKFKPAKKTNNKIGKFIKNVPLSCKDSVPVISDTFTDRVIWVHGVGFTDGYTPTSRTKKVYKFISI